MVSPEREASPSADHAFRDHLEFKKSFFEKRRPKFTDVLSRDAPRTYPWWTEVSVSTRPKVQVRAEPKL